MRWPAHEPLVNNAQQWLVHYFSAYLEQTDPDGDPHPAVSQLQICTVGVCATWLTNTTHS
jgi:hypothetical protein